MEHKGNNNYSSLLKDLMSLERDYAFKENLLKMKDEEIERCSLANKKLQEEINNKLSEIQDLQCNIFKLESEHVRAKQELENEKNLHQQTIERFNEEVKKENHSKETLAEQHKKNLRKQENELRKYFESVQDEREYEFHECLKNIENDLKQEKQTVNIISEKLKKQVDEFLQTQNKLRLTEEKYLCEKLAFEQEINSLQIICDELATELAYLKHDKQLLECNISTCSSENKKFQQDLKILNQETKSLTQQVKDLSTQNENLKQKLKEASMIYGRAVAEARELKKKNLEWQRKNNELCCDERHKKFEELEAQNVILQNVIKTMKKEREQLEIQTKKDVLEAEKRIERLEEFVNYFKESFNYSHEYF